MPVDMNHKTKLAGISDCAAGCGGVMVSANETNSISLPGKLIT